MILRPSKIFVSFHQLRQYFQTKISELVVTTHQQPSSTATKLANFSTTQQSIVLFSDIQRSLIQKAYYLQQPVTKRNPLNDKLLLKVIQQHFSIVKVFSQPALHGRAMWRPNTQPMQQLRTMMSSSGGGGGTTFMTWGFPRTAMVGVGRSHGFGATRQFSTAKSPTCVNLFQNTAPQQPNIVAHISSRIFSPAGTKMNNPSPPMEEKPKYVPFYSSEQDLSSGDESVYSCHHRTTNARMFSQQEQNKGMVDIVEKSRESKKHAYVRRGATRRNSKRVVKMTDAIVRNDEFSIAPTERVIASHKTKRKLSSVGRVKHPPDHHVKKRSMSVGNVYLLVSLDSVPFLSTWSTQSLNSSFIDSVESVAEKYQMHIQHVLNLLERLRFSGKKFRIVARQAELRIYFPSSSQVQSEHEAFEFLKEIQIDGDEECFHIIVEEKADDYFTYDHHKDDVGPGYFKDLQLFLDRTDYLIQTSSSAFSNRSR